MPVLSQRILQRMFLGFVAGALAVLVFHQGIVTVLFNLGLTPLAPYRTMLVPPFGVPAIVSLCFWGGVYGALFGAVAPRLPAPLWAAGLAIGLLAMLIGWFVVAPLKGLPIAVGFVPWPMARSLLINLTWGLGTGLLLPLLSPRRLRRRALG
ncbi:MAG: hypothetical protein P4L71_19105 [Acetobacteraceae bacterium]|nr:hypothetical protein [Acetobacteraceae bacterium]